MNTFFAGELLMRLECEDLEHFCQADRFRIRYTGAEANAALAMCALGAENIYLLSAVPDHPLGHSCLGEMRKYGADTSLVKLGSPRGRLGLFFLETGSALRPSQIIYDRAGSVFAETSAEDFNFPGIFNKFPAPGWLHFSGTFPALGATAKTAAFAMVKAAKEAGYTVSFDLNYRSALWSAEEAGETFRQLAEYTDVLISNLQVAEAFLETPADKLCRRFGFQCVAYSLREEEGAGQTSFGGGLLRSDGGCIEVPVRSFPVLDRVGGGDAFAGGMIYALQQEWHDEYRLKFAVACGILKHATRGDFSLSTRKNIESLLAGDSLAIRR